MKKIAKLLGLTSLVLAMSFVGISANLVRADTNIATNAATAITSTGATLNGTNGSTLASDTSFWLGATSAGPFTSSTNPVLPSGWVGADSLTQLANAPFSDIYTGLTPNTLYYFVAWSDVGGTWYPGTVMTFTTSTTTTTNVVTNAATAITSTDATLNGTNGSSDATGHSFWVSLSPFVTTSSTVPSGVYSTTDLGAIAANATFSAPLSSATGLPTITPNTLYYFAAWSNVGGTWYPGAVMTFTTSTTGTTTTPVLTSVALTSSDSTYTTTVGGTSQYMAAPLDQNDVAFVGATTTFTSSDPTIATVNSTTGMVTGVALGTSTITATSVSGNTTVTDTATITVATTMSGGKGNGNGNHFGDHKNQNHGKNNGRDNNGNNNKISYTSWSGNSNNNVWSRDSGRK